MPYLLFSITNTTGNCQIDARLKTFIDLTLIGRTVAKVGKSAAAVLSVFVGEA